MAGGLAGCAAQTIGGGTGGATTSTSGAGGSPIPVCNANPDPCCECTAHYGFGGFGGAACIDKSVIYIGDAGLTCAGELACAQAPTKQCCDLFLDVVVAGPLVAACADAGPGDAGGD